MRLRSLLKKAGIGLGSLLLAGNLGCNSSSYNPNTDLQRLQPLEQENLEDKIVYSEPDELSLWRYVPPLNILGGLLLRDFTHESSHAVAALAIGMEIEDYHPIRFISGKYSERQTGYVKVTDESYVNASNTERAIAHIAGPVADIALTEVINYNLRNGNVSEAYQPFWATASLVSRWCLVGNAIFGVKGQMGNDFCGFAEYTGVSEKTSLGVVLLYTALSAKRIKKELEVVFGGDPYPVNTRKSGVDLIPYKGGLKVSYSLHF